MSRSCVKIGAPSRIAATPPTMTNSTSCRTRISRSRKNLVFDASIAQGQNSVEEILQGFEALHRGEAQEPADLAEIHAVRSNIQLQLVRLGDVLSGGLHSLSIVQRRHDSAPRLPQALRRSRSAT